MVNPVTVSLFMSLLSITSLYVQYKEILILKALYYVAISVLFVTIYLIVRRTHVIKKMADRMVVLSVSSFVVQALASYIYFNWKLTSIFSEVFMMKITLVVLMLLAVYVNFAYIRAEQSYKKKRGNQRIKREPSKSYMEILRERKKQEDNQGVTFTLGYSADNEDG